MIWQDVNSSFGEESKDYVDDQIDPINQENTEKDTIQLNKYKQSIQEITLRATFRDILSDFGELIVMGNFQEITQTLLTEDCKGFLSGSKRYGHLGCIVNSRKDFCSLFDERKIHLRIIKETHIDVQNGKACQICVCKVSDNDEPPTDEISFEIFTFNNLKISDYRATFALITPREKIDNPLGPTHKDKMLARVKELNYALAGEPDLEKAASLLYKTTEYKMWSWDLDKCLLLKKENFIEGFQRLQDQIIIRTIVPYELSSDGKTVVGTYVYHLEDQTHQKYVWLSTAVYSFDKDLNFSKISQLGELHREEEANIGFEAISREEIISRIHKINRTLKPGVDLWYNNLVLSNCVVHRFAPPMGAHKGWQRTEGLKDVSIPFEMSIRDQIDVGPIEIVDILIDHHDPSYEVAILLISRQGMYNGGSSPSQRKDISALVFAKMAFENGKLAKLLELISGVPKFFLFNSNGVNPAD